MTDIKKVPAIPGPDMFVGPDGVMAGPGYSYLDQLATTLSEVRALLSTVEEATETNAASIVELQGVEFPPSGIFRQRSPQVQILGGSPIGPVLGGTTTTVLQDSFTCLEEDGRLCFTGNVARSHGSGGNFNTGTVIRLYADGADTGLFKYDWAATSVPVINTPFYFEYTPGDTNPHTYQIRVTMTISTIFGYANWMYLEELAPNQE